MLNFSCYRILHILTHVASQLVHRIVRLKRTVPSVCIDLQAASHVCPSRSKADGPAAKKPRLGEQMSQSDELYACIDSSVVFTRVEQSAAATII